MKCVICGQVETVPGETSVLLERGDLSLVVNNVPAQICPNCGEAYADQVVTCSLLRKARKWPGPERRRTSASMHWEETERR